MSKNPAGDTLLHDRAHDFLDVYVQGTGRTVDRSTVIPLIRDGLRTEICRACTDQGEKANDNGYTETQIKAFWAMRDAAL